MSDSRGHPCSICGNHDAPLYRFACHRCYVRMPEQLRKAATRAYKFRLANPSQYRETLATVLLWNRDRREDFDYGHGEGE